MGLLKAIKRINNNDIVDYMYYDLQADLSVLEETEKKVKTIEGKRAISKFKPETHEYYEVDHENRVRRKTDKELYDSYCSLYKYYELAIGNLYKTDIVAYNYIRVTGEILSLCYGFSKRFIGTRNCQNREKMGIVGKCLVGSYGGNPFSGGTYMDIKGTTFYTVASEMYEEEKKKAALKEAESKVKKIDTRPTHF